MNIIARFHSFVNVKSEVLFKKKKTTKKTIVSYKGCSRLETLDFYLTFCQHAQRGNIEAQIILFKISHCFPSITMPFSLLLHGHQIRAMF